MSHCGLVVTINDIIMHKIIIIVYRNAPVKEKMGVIIYNANSAKIAATVPLKVNILYIFLNFASPLIQMSLAEVLSPYQ